MYFNVNLAGLQRSTAMEVEGVTCILLSTCTHGAFPFNMLYFIVILGDGEKEITQYIQGSY